MDPVDRVIVDNSPDAARTLLIIDAPALLVEGEPIAGQVRVWADDLRDREGIPTGLLVDKLDAASLTGVDLVWLRLPKALAALDEYAELIAKHADPTVQVVAGGRVKYMTHSMNEVLAAHFGNVSASLGQQKSRALRAAIPMPSEPTWPRSKVHTDLGITLWSHGGTFAGTKVDLGTQLMIKHLKKIKGKDVLDLGSGNGVLATLIARHDNQARVHAVDVSWDAWDATRRTAEFNRVKVDARLAADLENFGDASMDLVVCNPPFHRGAAKDSEPALEMFAEAARVLSPGGEFWCVYNSHLPWKARLTDLIGPTSVVEQNTGYTLTRSERR